MKKYVKEFFFRGMMFGGFGPIVLAIIYYIVSVVDTSTIFEGKEILSGIISVYLLAFVQAGASVFNQIESFSIPKSLFCHLSVLYLAYTSCYLINSWIPFDPKFLLVFTAIFLIVYFCVWITVFVAVKITSRKLNAKLKS